MNVEKINNQLKNKINNLEDQYTPDSLNATLEKLLKIISDDRLKKKNLLPLQSKISLLFQELLAIYQKEGKTISEFKKEIYAFFHNRENLPNLFLHVRPDQQGKRQPNTIESIIATLERMEMMEKLQEVFKKICKGIIVGGSLAYGPFYNIRDCKKNDSSDIDAIFILDHNNKDENWDSFLKFSNISNTEKKEFMQRKKIFFDSLLPKGQADIISQKFHFTNTNYDISAHFFTDDSFDELLAIKIEDETQNSDKIVTIKDFKLKSYPHSFCSQYNFEGKPFNYKVPEQKATDMGIITELPAYIISNHKFHPGLYQSHIIPISTIFYDKNGEITEKILAFESKIKNYIINNYGEENIEDIMLKSHSRSSLLPAKR